MIDIEATIEIEKKLLSALMLREGASVPTAAAMLRPQHFYRAEHNRIYKAIMELSAEGVPLNALLVEERLARIAPKWDAMVMHRYLFGLIDLEYTTARVEHYAKSIKEQWIMRRLAEAGRQIAEEAETSRAEMSEVIGEAERKILSVTEGVAEGGAEPVSEILGSSLAGLQARVNRAGDLTGVTSGLADIDRVLNGFSPSDLILLAARPSMGKTALALNIAVNASWKEATVLIYSLEMSKEQLGNRLLSSWSGVNSQKLKTGQVSDEELRAVINAAEEMSGMKLYIDDAAGQSLSEMSSKARRLKHEVGLDMLIIDYLQLMQGARTENRVQEVSEISRGLKILARELNVPILALSQLSRQVEMRAEKKPQLSDLRESGSLEQDADVVMFLYRDEYYNRDETGNENIAEVIIAKNRNGPTTSVRLMFDKNTMKFGDLTR